MKRRTLVGGGRSHATRPRAVYVLFLACRSVGYELLRNNETTMCFCVGFLESDKIMFVISLSVNHSCSHIAPQLLRVLFIICCCERTFRVCVCSCCIPPFLAIVHPDPPSSSRGYLSVHHMPFHVMLFCEVAGTKEFHCETTRAARRSRSSLSCLLKFPNVSVLILVVSSCYMIDAITCPADISG